MPMTTAIMYLVRNGSVVQIDGERVRAEASPDGTAVLRYKSPVSGDLVTRNYSNMAAAEAAGNELEADYLAFVQARNSAQQTFTSKWG